MTSTVQYIILNYVILKLNSSVTPSSKGYISQYTPWGVYRLIVSDINMVIISVHCYTYWATERGNYIRQSSQSPDSASSYWPSQSPTDLHWPSSTGQCSLTALFANHNSIASGKWDSSFSLCTVCAMVCNDCYWGSHLCKENSQVSDIVRNWTRRPPSCGQLVRICMYFSLSLIWSLIKKMLGLDWVL